MLLQVQITFFDIVEKVIIPIMSAFIGALLAFRYQNSIELKRDKRAVVQTLMIYRNVGAQELDWIKALNAIDIAFNDEIEVKRLYHLFLEQTDMDIYFNGEWLETYFLMIYEMAKCCGYSNLTLDEIKQIYTPVGLDQHYPNRIIKTEDINDKK